MFHQDSLGDLMKIWTLALLLRVASTLSAHRPRHRLHRLGSRAELAGVGCHFAVQCEVKGESEVSSVVIRL